MAKTLCTVVDDELLLKFGHACSQIAAAMGIPRISTSVVLRQLIRQAINDQRVPFDVGWVEGYQAGYSAVLIAAQEAINALPKNPAQDAGIGVSQNMVEAAGGG